ncbi:hypothetical protein RG963_11745 [Methanosarcina sp. Z-7115]|uniref:Uncharacterized protein n=1 Tax=Methanosarcina baikalica TaxID=3073890 RepID=A0ABU2D375_9EURY|nr:hypothetical protein [Methanosarcina sp. Z-7115]MDR7666441.1 hypothetical protein [Methanosarcina sp. Z-7115]
MEGSSSESTTAPKELPSSSGSHKSSEAAANIGVAIRYWLELEPYPPGSARSLWLFVDDDWRHLDNPNVSIQVSVQEAFCECSQRLEVLVWYSGDAIKGLVVKTK